MPSSRIANSVAWCDKSTDRLLGIAPKVTQSVLTAAFLFAFKDVLYEQTVRLRNRVPRKALAV
jgi:hypothetical protein